MKGSILIHSGLINTLNENVHNNVCNAKSDTVESDELDKQSIIIDGNSTNVDFQTIDHEDEAETPAGVTDTRDLKHRTNL